MDMNSVAITGRVYDMGLSPMLTQELNVAEGKISVEVSAGKDGPETDEFSIRAYGKKADFIGRLKDGTPVCVQGYLREDLRVNGSAPTTVRSKVYINVNVLKVMENRG